MGWLYPYHTHNRKALIEELTAPFKGKNGETVALRSCVRGNVLWVKNQFTPTTGEPTTYITCHLMQKHGTWGYKTLCESSGPSYYHCPLSYLEGLSEPSGYAEEWREDVRKYWHDRRKKSA